MSEQRPTLAVSWSADGNWFFTSDGLDTQTYTWPGQELEKQHRHGSHCFAAHAASGCVARGMKATVELFDPALRRRRVTCKNAANSSVPSCTWVGDRLVSAALGRGPVFHELED